MAACAAMEQVPDCPRPTWRFWSPLLEFRRLARPASTFYNSLIVQPHRAIGRHNDLLTRQQVAQFAPDIIFVIW